MLKQSIYISVAVAFLTLGASADRIEKQNNKENSSKEYKKSNKENKNQSKKNNAKKQGKAQVTNDNMIGEYNDESSELTQEQKEGLIFMIEEEKVARDVYLTLYDTWGTRVFTNIAKSEQKHMDAVQNILNKYNLASPSTLGEIGKFEDEHLQEMYNDLIEKGKSSQIDALEVGVTIEEVDIADLEELIEAGVPSDIENVYNNLLKGSYNHLNAFNRQLSQQ